MLEEVPCDRRDVAFQADVDSVIFASSSLRAFRILPKIHIKRGMKVMPTLNTKLAEQFALRLPQESGKKRRRFYDFLLSGVSLQAIRVLFQTSYRISKEEFYLPNVSLRHPQLYSRY